MTNQQHPITPPPPHLLKKFSAQAQDETKKRNGAGYLKTFATLCIEWAMNCQSISNDHQIRSSEIEPPPELVQEWWEEADQYQDDPKTYFDHVATQAARWGADQELEACVNYVDNTISGNKARALRAARRPKPPSLKEVALQMLSTIERDAHYLPEITDTIRRALEALPE